MHVCPYVCLDLYSTQNEESGYLGEGSSSRKGEMDFHEVSQSVLGAGCLSVALVLDL